MMKTVSLDVVSDVMCPWCYVGMRRLEKALDQIDDIQVDVQWRPYQLDQTIPSEGMDRQTYLSNKFGGKARAREVYARIEEAGQYEGIDFAFDKIEKSPNTLDCHRLIHWAQSTGKQNALVEHLFQLFFEQGADLTQHDVLVAAAEHVGMDGVLVRDLLESDKDLEAVKAQVSHAQQIGVTGVPCFIADQKFGLMGAQDPQALAEMIRKAASEQ
ncbi:DsbA family oxidoreductase [Coralliovum pocilloporae]|uniref:DsbA family oxidoreductase n=1 Tax=Coralliovum pocilloporae TaxID=3066369 RepID=UPI00330782D8